MPWINGIKIPDKEFSYKDADVSDSAVDIATKDVWVKMIRIANVSGGAITIDILDKQGTPLEYFDGVSIAANSVAQENFEKPILMEGGITVQASAATGLNLVVEGWQHNGLG